jgi:hypothetical protein
MVVDARVVLVDSAGGCGVLILKVFHCNYQMKIMLPNVIEKTKLYNA